MKEKILKVITEALGVEAGVITESTIISEVNEWDSLMQLIILSELQEKVGVEIPIEVALEIKSVADIITYVEERK